MTNIYCLNFCHHDAFEMLIDSTVCFLFLNIPILNEVSHFQSQIRGIRNSPSSPPLHMELVTNSSIGQEGPSHLSSLMAAAHRPSLSGVQFAITGPTRSQEANQDLEGHGLRTQCSLFYVVFLTYLFLLHNKLVCDDIFKFPRGT